MHKYQLQVAISADTLSAAPLNVPDGPIVVDEDVPAFVYCLGDSPSNYIPLNFAIDELNNAVTKILEEYTPRDSRGNLQTQYMGCLTPLSSGGPAQGR